MSLPTPLSDSQLAEYRRDGFLIVRQMFTPEEITLLGDTARRDKALDEHAIDRADSQGTASRLALWNHPGDNIYGMFARSDTMVGAMSQILDDEPYHYHSKMIMKEPKVGGAWEWHQDYGYWYQNGVLTPNLCSVMIAVDRATRENGCLQVIRGSHHMGRVDHGRNGDQAGADMERVNVALERMELVYCEMEPGDAVMFHSNTLHRSDANLSDKPRWTLICCYNAKGNNPYREAHHPCYTPLKIVPRAAIVEVGRQGLVEHDESTWLDPNRDVSAASLAN